MFNKEACEKARAFVYLYIRIAPKAEKYWNPEKRKKMSEAAAKEIRNEIDEFKIIWDRLSRESAQVLDLVFHKFGEINWDIMDIVNFVIVGDPRNVIIASIKMGECLNNPSGALEAQDELIKALRITSEELENIKKYFFKMD